MDKKQKLNQVIAVEKSVKARAHELTSELYKLIQKPGFFDGEEKKYKPREEGDDLQPPQSRRVQRRASDMLTEFVGVQAELLDVTATKDVANCTAMSDIVVDGEVVAAQVPVTTLLFLEKALTDTKTYIERNPTLDPAEEWRFCDADGLYKTAPLETLRTKKTQRPIVLFPATDKHPAQTQLISEDVVVGTWNTTKSSGALAETKKKFLLERIEKLIKAVKYAREAANDVIAVDKNIGTSLYKWLVG